MVSYGCSAGAWSDTLTRINSNAAEVGPWVAKKIFGPWTGAPAIGLERRGEMVAGVIYENWNRRSVTCHIAVQGLLTPAYLAAIFHYPFVHLGCDKIIAPISEGNAESIKLVENMGFQEEACLHNAHPDGSLLLYTLERQKCRFIGERYGQRLKVLAA